MMTKEGCTEIVNFMTPAAAVLVEGHIVDMLNILLQKYVLA